MNGMTRLPTDTANPRTGQREQIIAWTRINGQETLRIAWQSAKRESRFRTPRASGAPQRRQE